MECLGYWFLRKNIESVFNLELFKTQDLTLNPIIMGGGSVVRTRAHWTFHSAPDSIFRIFVLLVIGAKSDWGI
jgi:hypothetical protein